MQSTTNKDKQAYPTKPTRFMKQLNVPADVEEVGLKFNTFNLIPNKTFKNNKESFYEVIPDMIIYKHKDGSLTKTLNMKLSVHIPMNTAYEPMLHIPSQDLFIVIENELKYFKLSELKEDNSVNPRLVSYYNWCIRKSKL